MIQRIRRVWQRVFQEERTARAKALGRDRLTHLKNRAAVTVAEVDGEGVETCVCPWG